MTDERAHRGMGPQHAAAGRESEALPEDDEELGFEFEPEFGLPLCAENYTTGVPLVSVDYFGFPAPQHPVVVKLLLALEHAVADEGPERPRILVFERRRSDGAYHLPDLVAILTVRKSELRVETARADVTDSVRRRVASALGAGARHLRSTVENPLEGYLDG